MRIRIAPPLLLAAAILLPGPAAAHCDGLDGPVVTAARAALESRDPNGVLIWVQPDDEAELRRAFETALSVRRQGREAREMADHYFFETLVRLHRAGEGAAYHGLQPAGRDLGPAIRLADEAVATGSDREVAEFAAAEVEHGIRERFAALQRARGFRPDDIAAGRDYIAAYVSFVHYVEAIHQAAASPATGHYEEAQAGAVEHH